MPTALILLADGFEELEAITVTDLCVRAGIEVTRASLRPGPVTASRHTQVLPDCVIDEIASKDFDAVILPGGLPGADTLADDPRVIELVQTQVANNKLVAAICAAPRVLMKADVLIDKQLTCFPGALDSFDTRSCNVTGDAITMDWPLLTSRGPGTAMDFALTLIELLCDQDTKANVEQGLAR